MFKKRDIVQKHEVDSYEKLMAGVLENLLSQKGMTADDLNQVIEDLDWEPLTDMLSGLMVRTLKRRMPKMVKDQQSDIRQFQKRHHRLWKNGLDLLEATIFIAFELGESFNRHHRAHQTEVDYKLDALTRLHARAIHVAREVQTLMKAGFADGALGRWRTAHEISVVAVLIQANDQTLARRYLRHDGIESYKASLQFQEHADALGQEKLSDEDMKVLKDNRDNLVAEFGNDYGASYGWAAELLSTSHVKFEALEKAAGITELRPYYRMASHNVHAPPKGITFKLGLAEGSTPSVMLAGPSNYGLTDPGQLIARSLATTTHALLGHLPNIDTEVNGKILESFVNDVGEALWKTQHDMEEIMASEEHSDL